MASHISRTSSGETGQSRSAWISPTMPHIRRRGGARAGPCAIARLSRRVPRRTASPAPGCCTDVTTRNLADSRRCSVLRHKGCWCIAPVSRSGQVTLVVSVDAEEDAWAPTRERATVENVRELTRLSAFLHGLGMRATYFVTYQVALQPWAADILSEVRARWGGEVGAHLHPWNTPPPQRARRSEEHTSELQSQSNL